MERIDGGFFRHPKYLGKECCFTVALINYFRIQKEKFNQENLFFYRALGSPYTDPSGGIDMLLQPKLVEFLTHNEYTATLFHLINPWKDKVVDDTIAKIPVENRGKAQDALEEMVKTGQIRYSLEDVKRLSQPVTTNGAIANITGVDSSGMSYGHSIVRLNPLLYGERSHIDVDGEVYRLNPAENMSFTSCLEIRKNS